MRTWCMLTLAVPLVLAPVAAADETTVDSKIVSIGLFKNGLAVVKRTVELSGNGATRIENMPSPLHGTFWIESAGPVSVVATTREVDAPARNKAGLDFQEELLGKQVTIFFREGNIPSASGKVVQIARAKGDEAWNRTYQQPQYYYYGMGGNTPGGPGRYLVLETAKGRSYIDTSMISYVSADGATATVKQRRPVLLLSPDGPNKPAGLVTISYLTKGLAWAPAYRVYLNTPTQLTIEQQAVVKNEMEDFKDAELQLISGFPSIQFAHVTSPLSLDTTWASFFTQLNTRMASGHAATGNAVAQQARVMDNTGGADPSVDLSATPSGEGVDLHYQSIGKRTLAEGDSLLVPVAAGKADYQRIVEWFVPDTRDVDGRFAQDYQRQQDPEKYEDAVWDALRFKNPLPFAMTTGPAMIAGPAGFAGQRLSYWVNPGEQTTLRVTKALSIRTRAVEQEEQGGRDIVWVGGHDYRRISVKGELRVNNHRKEDISVVLRRQFSGELTKADGDPKSTLREEGVYSINKRNELVWSLPLKAGEETTLTYQYVVLVRN